jgi:hypothetical protein
MSKILRVFISSTAADLKEYRDVASKAIIEAGWYPDMMENFGAMPEDTVEACYAKLQDCDLVVLLVAFRQGWVPTQEQGGNGVDSITSLEWQYSQDPQHKKKDVLIFCADERKPWPFNLIDKGPAGDWIMGFRSKLGKPADFFEFETDPELPNFRNMVLHALLNYKDKILKGITPPPPPPHGLGNFSDASRTLLSGKCIPFLGPGVYGNGDLSVCALRKALGDEECTCEDLHESCEKLSLATAAEFKDPPQTRAAFLDDLKEIIIDQEGKRTTVPIYDLIPLIKPPPLIVSATLDLLLERKLHETDQHCRILCHAIRSEGLPKGILVFNGPGDDSPHLYPANKIPIDLEAEKKPYTVYKPLGSPLLSPRNIVYQPPGSPEENLPSEGVDTVVITEKDYQILLRLLGLSETGVPAAFTACFRKYPPIFLGYLLDVWHYRLVGHFIKSIFPSETGQLFAVRLANLPREQKAWKGLGVDLVSMDLGVFSQNIENTLQLAGGAP